MVTDTQTGAETPDYGDFLARPTDEKFAQLALLVKQQVDAEAQVLKCTKELKKAQEDLKRVSEVELPEFMENVIGLDECKTRDGIKVKIKEDIRAGITKEKAGMAHAWLRANGHGNLIKHVMKIEFAKGEDDKARKLSDLLSEQGYEADDNESVHAQTLGAWVREKLEAGDELPLELLGVHRQKVAKIELAK